MYGHLVADSSALCVRSFTEGVASLDCTVHVHIQMSGFRARALLRALQKKHQRPSPTRSAFVHTYTQTQTQTHVCTALNSKSCCYVAAGNAEEGLVSYMKAHHTHKRGRSHVTRVRSCHANGNRCKCTRWKKTHAHNSPIGKGTITYTQGGILVPENKR